MRLILVLFILLVVVFGALFSALNATSIPVDFYFFQLQASTGLALLGSLLTGWLLGGLVAWLGQVPRLRRESRKLRQELREARAAQPPMAKVDGA